MEDNSCKATPNNYTFGGVFQQCVQSGSTDRDVCSAIIQKNPLTGDFSCPDGYEAVLLNEGKTVTNWNERVCHDQSHGCGLFGWQRCHSNVSGFIYYKATVVAFI